MWRPTFRDTKMSFLWVLAFLMVKDQAEHRLAPTSWLDPFLIVVGVLELQNGI